METYFWRPAVKEVGKVVPSTERTGQVLELLTQVRGGPWVLHDYHRPALRAIMVASGDRTWEVLIDALNQYESIDVLTA